jgi:intein-encoded DNA endonuclease-like protein
MKRNKEIVDEIKKLYSFGYTYNQIREKIKTKYNINISKTTIWRALKFSYVLRN